MIDLDARISELAIKLPVGHEAAHYDQIKQLISDVLDEVLGTINSLETLNQSDVDDYHEAMIAKRQELNI